MYNIFISQEKDKKKSQNVRKTCYWNLIFVNFNRNTWARKHTKHTRHVVTWARRHARHVGTWARKHTGHVGTWARNHIRHEGTLTCEHLSAQGRWRMIKWARKARWLVGAWVRKRAGQFGAWALEAGNLAGSLFFKRFLLVLGRLSIGYHSMGFRYLPEIG